MGVISKIEITKEKEKNEKHTPMAFSCIKERKFALLNTTMSYFNKLTYFTL